MEITTKKTNHEIIWENNYFLKITQPNHYLTDSTFRKNDLAIDLKKKSAKNEKKKTGKHVFKTQFTNSQFPIFLKY